MVMTNDADLGPMLQEAARELESAIHDARVAFDCIGLGEIDRAHEHIRSLARDGSTKASLASSL